MSIIDLLCPRLYVSSLFDINLEDLRQRGIRGILFDLDNTIIPRHLNDFSAEVSCWMNEVRQRNFKACILSNNRAKRVYALAEALGLPAVCHAVKPRRRAFCRALELMGTTSAETAIIGDQIFTDILGGNRLGLYTILVASMPGREFWVTRLINRRLEKFVLRRLWQSK